MYFTISQLFKIIAKTCGCPHKGYNLNFALNLFASIPCRSTSSLDNFNKPFKLSVLFGNPTPVQDALPTALPIAKYIKKDLQYILKTVPKVQTLAPASIILPEGS